MRTALPLCILLLAPACGGDDEETPQIDAATGAIDAAEPPDADPDQPDAGPAPDAEPSSVVEVTCAGATIAVTVTAPGFAYAFNPDDGGAADEYTIDVNEIVRFTMPGLHDAASGPPNAPDGQFYTGFNETKCFQFTEAGSFPFHCVPHDFAATLIVQ